MSAPWLAALEGGGLIALLCLVGLHRRSRDARFRDRDGLLKSVCRRCGVRMVRDRTSGRWLAFKDRDLRRRTRPLRRAIDKLTGPIIFLLMLGAALGLMLWLRGPPIRPPASHLAAPAATVH